MVASTNLFTGESHLMVTYGVAIFLISQHLTVLSSLPDTILLVPAKTAEVTDLQSERIIKCN